VQLEGEMVVMVGSQQTERYPSLVIARWLFVPPRNPRSSALKKGN